MGEQMNSQDDTADMAHDGRQLGMGESAQVQMMVASRRASTVRSFACCGPGKKRYLISVLCMTCLTIVIGMRAEMLSIITKLNDTHAGRHAESSNLEPEANRDSRAYLGVQVEITGPAAADEHLFFKPLHHRQLPWTATITEDLVENAVFFAYLIASPIGGYLTVRHDSSLLLGCSVAMTCGLNLFLPLAETIGSNIDAKLALIIILRLLQGMAEGCLIPAVFGTLRYWTPESERSTLISLAVIGVSLGPLIGLPVCAEIEQKWGWGVVFYIYANLGLIWCIFWWRMVDEKPQKDRNLSKAEKIYLKENTSQQLLFDPANVKIPWVAIFTSKPIMAIFLTYAADDWTFQISSVCMQTFYQQRYNANVQKTIFLLSFPFLSRSIFVPIGGFLADVIKLKTPMSCTTIRKVFSGIGFGLKGIFFLALGFAKTEVHATIILSMALGISGLAVAGYAVSVIELAPKFAGLIMGFANSISTLTGILSTVIATVVVHYLSTGVGAGWIVAMSLAAGSQFFAAIFFFIFASSQEQAWAKGGVVVSASGDVLHSQNCLTANRRGVQKKRHPPTRFLESDDVEANYR
ncbi:Vesicular glutamate transporter 2 [Echinococcus granulosus]|nr:Vesicular glutamate transporter 2 [Echinococcus granulosus]